MDFFDALRNHILHMDPATIFRWFLFACIGVGFLTGFTIPIGTWLLDHLPSEKARYKRTIDAQLLLENTQLKMELETLTARNIELVKENHRATALLREERSHSHNWNIRANRTLEGRKDAGT